LIGLLLLVMTGVTIYAYATQNIFAFAGKLLQISMHGVNRE
jgi:hypothetical protein